MALEGSLKEFGLADILQLIYFQHKTGVLTLESRLDRIRLLFYEGNVVGAESKRRIEANRLGKVLVKKGLVKEEELAKALEEQNSTGEKVGNLLVKHGIVKKQQLQEIINSQITETVVQLFGWKEGIYEFVPQGVPTDKEIPIAIDTQHLLMEGLRIIDEWSVIEGKLSLDTIFEKRQQPDTGLNSDEQDILQYIDGESDVSTVVDVSNMDNFQASKALVSLMEKGVIEPREEDVIAPQVTSYAIKKEPGKKMAIPFMGIITILLFFIAFFIAFNQISINKFADEETFAGSRASADIDNMRFWIEVYKYEKGFYPPSLAEIGEKNDRWKKPYVYKADKDSFVLFSTGPDGKEGTEDDIY
jgi:hypothetical protein